MRIQFYLVGYDRGTGSALTFHAVRPRDVAVARSIADMPRDAAGDWPLSSDAARRIASLVGVEIDADRMEFCLEPNRELESEHAAKAKAKSTINSR